VSSSVESGGAGSPSWARTGPAVNDAATNATDTIMRRQLKYSADSVNTV